MGKSVKEECWQLSGGLGTLSVRIPAYVCQQPAFVLNLALDRTATLSMQPWSLVGDIFVAAGHYAGSIDLPNHGTKADRLGSELAGMAAAMAMGVDVFDEVRSAAQCVFKRIQERGIVEAGNWFVAGTSRGGLAALHAMAACPEIAAAALIAPVTDLSKLSEFASLGVQPLLRTSSAESLIPQLVGRSIYIEIGPADDRVSTSACLDFFSRLAARSPAGSIQLHIDNVVGHRASDATHHRCAAYLLRVASENSALRRLEVL